MKYSPDYDPPNYAEKIKTIEELEEHLDNIGSVDFYSMVDSSIEGAEYFAKDADKAIRRPTAAAQGNALSLKQDILSDLQNDFEEKLKLYVFLVSNGMEENAFPFRGWLSCLTGTKENANINYMSVFASIASLGKEHEDLAKENIAEYLLGMTNRVSNLNDFFPALENFLIGAFPKANIADVLAAKDLRSIMNALSGERVELTTEAKLFFQYAAFRPNENWIFKSVMKNKGLVISSSSSNFDEVFEAFSQTDIWKRIESSEQFKKLFINEMINGKRIKKQFYSQRSTGKTFVPGDTIYWDNAKAFVKHLIKGDVQLAEYFVEKFIGVFPKNKTEELNGNAIALINIAIHEKLHKEMPISGIKEKKIKI